MPQQLVHITVGYPRTAFMDLLGKSSELNGCRFIALPRHWNSPGFSMFGKETLVKSYFESGEIDMNSIVMFTDAYDVLIVEHASAILEKFRQTGADIVFAAESNFYPTTPDGRQAVKAQFDKFNSKWRYLNGGGFIGYAWAAKLMVDYVSRRVLTGDYDPSWESNDQPFIQDFFLANHGAVACRVMLDINDDFFCCLNESVEDFVFSRSQVRRKSSGRSVSVLHANGGKHNMAILPRVWTLMGGDEDGTSDYDLRVATVGERLLRYDAARNKLVPTDSLDNATAVFLVRGNRYAIAVCAENGLLTFVEQGSIHTGALTVNIWEIVNVRDEVTTFHQTSLRQHCDIPDDEEVVLAPLPLAFLLRPEFDPLMELVSQYSHKF